MALPAARHGGGPAGPHRGARGEAAMHFRLDWLVALCACMGLFCSAKKIDRGS
jgi:hypothetical protein